MGKEVRRRTKTKRFDFEYLENEDLRLLQQVFVVCHPTQMAMIINNCTGY